MELPKLPCSFQDFPLHIQSATTQKAVKELVEPFISYESKLRQIYAQEPTHPAASEIHLVPIFQNGTSEFNVRARDLSSESLTEKEKYLLPLSDKERKKHGAPATISTLQEFKSNFALFSEQSLSELKWDNVVASGSAVLTALLPVQVPHNASKRALRTYYHEELAPASDVDLFMYGLDEEQAIEKIKQIEKSIRDSVLSEVTVVRTKNAITIVSEYPVRHVQVVLRLYKSISEILTGFDVDSSCIAYDGTQVWAAPRALSALCTQVNSIDLTRRSPSYENRLSKYAHRGFEVHWPPLDRSRIDPTIFERSFGRVFGLARLLVLEKLPHPQDRDQYLQKRRAERGRPELPWSARHVSNLPGNVKEAQPDDVPEWLDEDEVSNYHTFSLPYGPKYTSKRIERLLYSKDLLLNAEWNKDKDRETNLHRHPAFFGRVEDVIQDCCGYCPKPVTDEDLMAWEEESKTFITGGVTFIKDDPGRQAIGSFRPLTSDDWTNMAYIGNTTKLCQAIVAHDLEDVLDWLKGGDADVTRRDHTGRTPLQLAVMCSSEEIVQCLIDHGARINARLYNGFTALHLAAHRGNTTMIKALLDKSAENELEEERMEERRKAARREKITGKAESREPMNQSEEGDGIESEKDESSSDSSSIEPIDIESEADDVTEGSFIKIKAKTETELEVQDDVEGPDVYDVDVVAWDAPFSPLHLAIMAGHEDVIRLLIDDYGADVLLPVKIMDNSTPRRPRAAILSLLLPMTLPSQHAVRIVKVLLEKGATPYQADMREITALEFIVAKARLDMFEVLKAAGGVNSAKALNHLRLDNNWYKANAYNPLLSAIRSGSTHMIDELLSQGANAKIDFDVFARTYNNPGRPRNLDEAMMKKYYLRSVEQPVILASRQECTVDAILNLIDQGADVNSMSPGSWEVIENPSQKSWRQGESVLDFVREQRKKLEAFSKEGPNLEVQVPEPLKDDDFYLEGLQQGTYQYFSASGDLERAKFIQAERAKTYKSDFEKAFEQASDPGRRAEKAAATDLAATIKKIEDALIERGAKSFYEMYPRLKEAKKPEVSPDDDTDPIDAYKTTFDFDDFGMDPKDKSRYIQLFEAAYSGDMETLKDLCLTSTESTAPLKIAVNDGNGFNCFNLAVLRGHYELARIVLEITAAQYNKKQDTKRAQYSLEAFDSDDDDDDDDESEQEEHLRIYEHIIDDEFTIDNIHDLSQDVKSTRKPLDLLNRCSDLRRMIDTDRRTALRELGLSSDINENPWFYLKGNKPWDKFKAIVSEEKHRTSLSLWTYAIHTNDVPLLEFLLEMESRYSMVPADELLSSFRDLTGELQSAMNNGYVSMISTIISQRGTLLPLDRLAEKSGTIIDEKPKYYQGLSVYGEKRKDWAKRDRRAVYQSNEEDGAPLLQAIYHGNLDVVKYFMSDDPARRYEEFAEVHDKDQRIRSLAKGSGGIPAAIKSWMNTRTNFALHMAVMSRPSRTNTYLEFLLKKLPNSYLEARSSSGHTPLHLALMIGNYPAFETLLAVGADQRTRDRQGRNLLHTFCAGNFGEQVRTFRMIVEMLDRDVVQDLLVEKCSGTEPGSLTPFALRLHTYGPTDSNDLKLLEAILDLSGGKVLDVMNGAGDYPLHYESRQNHLWKAKLFAKRRPDLLYKENAMGMTPVEVAEVAYFRDHIDNPPTVSESVHTRSILDKQDDQFLIERETEQSDTDNDSKENDDLPSTYPMYATLIRIAQTNPHPRQLVSILDSNEVARRLAGQQHDKNAEDRRAQAKGLWTKWSGRHDNFKQMYERLEKDDQGNTISDEVERWSHGARGRMESVPWKAHLEDNEEAFREAYEKWRDFASGKVEEFKCCEVADEENKHKRQGHQFMKA